MRKVALAATLLSLALVGSAAAQVPVYGVSSYGGYNYCPVGYTPVTPPNTLPPNATGVGYCQPVATLAYSVPAVTNPVVVSQPVVTTPVAYALPVATTAVAYGTPALATPVAYAVPATTSVAYSTPVIATPVMTSVAYVSSRRTLGRQVAVRTARADQRVALRRGPTIQAQQAVVTGQAARAQRVGFRTGQAQGRMGVMNRAQAH